MLRPKLNGEEQLQDYFAFCLASHHATVATFVPTDVDTKIRGILWRESRNPNVLRPVLRLALASRSGPKTASRSAPPAALAVTAMANSRPPLPAAWAASLNSAIPFPPKKRAAIEAEIDRQRWSLMKSLLNETPNSTCYTSL
jgi:hypothetical protein